MSVPRRKPDDTETLPSSPGAVESSSLNESAFDEGSASREVLMADDDVVARAIKRVTRDHRDLIVALAK